MMAVSLIDAGLDKERFDTDRTSSEVFVRIDGDIVLAKTAGVRVAALAGVGPGGLPPEAVRRVARPPRPGRPDMRPTAGP